MDAINKTPSRRDLMWFGAGLPILTLLLGALVTHRFDAPDAARTIWIVGGAISALYLIAPALRRPIFVGWMYITYPIGWVITNAVLLAFFFVVVTPIAFIVRLTRQDPLALRMDPNAPTYWVAREKQRDVGRYFRQF
ncbi:MAG: SxtJ family membrane protein [Actinomycetota bacterium]|nr:SxtJ family membrane protein [Actinomycetota bacterium]